MMEKISKDPTDRKKPDTGGEKWPKPRKKPTCDGPVKPF